MAAGAGSGKKQQTPQRSKMGGKKDLVLELTDEQEQEQEQADEQVELEQSLTPGMAEDDDDEADLDAHKRIQGMSQTDLDTFNAGQKKRGLIYLSRVPPFMKPAKLRHLMQQFGEVDRVFLQPEDPKIRKRRVKNGGNKKINYGEGWIEFLDKSIAKRVAASLNGTKVGGKRNSFHHDDLWCMKYLPGFKWHNLTERIAYDNAARERRLAMAMSQVQRDTNAYLDQVVKAKSIETAKKYGKAPSAEGHRPRPIRQRKVMASGAAPSSKRAKPDA